MIRLYFCHRIKCDFYLRYTVHMIGPGIFCICFIIMGTVLIIIGKLRWIRNNMLCRINRYIKRFGKFRSIRCTTDDRSFSFLQGSYHIGIADLIFLLNRDHRSVSRLYCILIGCLLIGFLYIESHSDTFAASECQRSQTICSTLLLHHAGVDRADYLNLAFCLYISRFCSYRYRTFCIRGNHTIGIYFCNLFVTRFPCERIQYAVFLRLISRNYTCHHGFLIFEHHSQF